MRCLVIATLRLVKRLRQTSHQLFFLQTLVLTIRSPLWRVSNITNFYQLARQISKIEPALEKARFQYSLIETP